jgi:signal transduction histidine kinase/BarA-like signal transduction histidine kinase
MDIDDDQASLPCPAAGVPPAVHSGNPELPLLLRIAALEEELTALRGTVSELREANEHLVLAAVNAESLREDAEAANRRQNEFLAMLAHELRNPLSPISMAASLLERSSGATPRLLDLARVIGRQVGHMAHLLDDLLDAARISSGKIMLKVEPMHLADVIQGAVETVEPRLQERAQQLALALPLEAIVVEGDRVRLTQVFTNLLGNASKYTGDGGRVRIAVESEPDCVRVIVEDNGTGMPAEVIPHIFDLFTQGPRSLARSEGGLGVGLNVVRNLVAMHHGSVDAESPGLGQGSRFTVVLPRSHSQPALAPPAPRPASVVRRRILLVEDNQDACLTLAELLRAEGHEVVCAHDGRSGLVAALERAYDVVLCDIGLPGLDGLDMMRALRASTGGARPLAIALTGYGQADDQARGLDAGYDAYLVKPVDAERLLTLIG